MSITWIKKYKKFYRHYSLTTVVISFILFFEMEKIVFGVDLFKTIVTFLDDARYVTTEEIGVSAVLIVISFVTDHVRLARKNRRKVALNMERLAVVRSTLATVHDAINNSLNSLLLVKMEAEKGNPLSSETLSLFGNLIDGMASELRTIGEMEIVSERNLSQGITVLDLNKKSSEPRP